MLNRVVAFLGAGCLAVCSCLAQAPAAKPALAFEVATIKLAPPLTPAMIQAGKIHAGLSVDGTRVDIGYLSLADMISAAYKVKSYQISGPGWMSTDRWDILAKMPEGATKDDLPAMLQALLAERFKLTIHRDSKQQPVYALVVAKGGHKLKEAPPEAEAPKPPENPGGQSLTLGTGNNQVRMSQNRDGQGMTVSGGGMAGNIKMSMREGGMRMEADRMAMPVFVEMIARFVDRPVVDQTELKGIYEVGLDLSMEDLMAVARASGVAASMGVPAAASGASAAVPAAGEPTGSIFTSVQQLGLRLEGKKNEVEVIVIDHLEKAPTEN
jgi:uncharacterized protein (TIGR03435 family)